MKSRFQTQCVRGLLTIFAMCACTGVLAADSIVLDLWPGRPPGETKELPTEADQTKPEDRLIAGKRIIKLGNVSIPQIAIHRPSRDMDTGAAVVICPGGGLISSPFQQCDVVALLLLTIG